MKLISNFQILQRDDNGFAHAVFEGTYEGGGSIEARVYREDDGVHVIYWTPCKREGSSWSVELDIPEGGLYCIEACVVSGHYAWRDKIKILHHIGVGDIYVTTGQSNMAGYGRDTAYDPPCLGVHAFSNTGAWCIATHPLAEANGSIFGYPEFATGTSPALSFARRLKERLGIPIGIIPAASGGTSLKEWHPEQDGSLYRAMCKRLEYTGVFKGFIWYQGCAEAIPVGSNSPVDYFSDFAQMVTLWRDKFGNLPILTVQLNRFIDRDGEKGDRSWGYVREAQRRAALEIPGVYIIPSYDLSVMDGIHNSSGANVTIGERLANLALAEIYHKPGQTSVTILRVEHKDDTTVLVHLTPGHHVIPVNNWGIGMNVEDDTGIIECCTVQPTTDGLLVHTARPYHLPAMFHYAWRAQAPAFVVRDIYDMPLLSCYGVEIQKQI